MYQLALAASRDPEAMKETEARLEHLGDATKTGSSRLKSATQQHENSSPGARLPGDGECRVFIDFQFRVESRRGQVCHGLGEMEGG